MDSVYLILSDWYIYNGVCELYHLSSLSIRTRGQHQAVIQMPFLFDFPIEIVQQLIWSCIYDYLRSIWLLTFPSDSETPTKPQSEST